MNLSVIWILGSKKKKNEVTLSCMEREFLSVSGRVRLMLYGAGESFGDTVKERFSGYDRIEIILRDMPEGAQVLDESNTAHVTRPDLVYVDAASLTDHTDAEGLVTMLYSGDTWSEGALSAIEELSGRYPEQILFMMQKIMPSPILEERMEGAFAKGPLSGEKEGIIDLSEDPSCYPYYLGGTFIRPSCLTKDASDENAGPDRERFFFLNLSMEKGEICFTEKAKYKTEFPYEGDPVFFRRLYQEEYYLDAIRDQWLPYLAKIRDEKGKIPEFIQYHLTFSLRCRYYANYNNKNKHVIEGKEEAFFELTRQLLSFVDDTVLLDEKLVEEARLGTELSWVFGIFKHGKDYTFHLIEKNGKLFVGDAGVGIREWEEVCISVRLMDTRDGHLSIDGHAESVLYSMADEIYLQYGEEKIPLTYNGRYTLSKYFGVSLFRGAPFHVEVEKLSKKGAFLGFFARIGEKVLPVSLSLTSHFSRMGPLFKANYWSFTLDRRYLMTKKEKGFWIRPALRCRVMLQEWILLNEMLFCRDLRAKLFILIRLAFFITRPFIKSRPVWMYLDKIYKGGDSAEYLYRYAVSRHDKNKHYYLIDKNTSDYKRLVDEGYKPLVRGSVLHRLVFLMADFMVISNSTVFAFNNFGTINSSYIRDLPDFHCCCVQHGMSVQKIALAQNRLRDNTRLYFCASKYEIENLSRPVYDYEGYDALKLTGVPRYDGLVNDDKKRIMISPTWRMQSAVPVKGSEGYQRGYNPMFKETPYFAIYNSLINDPRLLAAAKEYGYQICYVLHPIVSAQAKDFTTGEGVEVIPAAGDMSYEKMLCESSLMVTDFSGVQFDFAYMKKPILYLHHKDIPQHYEEGSFFYDTMAFGEIATDNDALIDLLIEYMKDGCRMKDLYKARVDDFFHFHDRENCKRIYEVMTDYQEKYITKKGKGK